MHPLPARVYAFYCILCVYTNQIFINAGQSNIKSAPFAAFHIGGEKKGESGTRFSVLMLSSRGLSLITASRGMGNSARLAFPALFMHGVWPMRRGEGMSATAKRLYRFYHRNVN
jgi:hypothetical protein